MSTEEKIRNVRGSFAMEGLVMTKDDENHAREIISEIKDVEEVVSELKQKYVLKVQTL